MIDWAKIIEEQGPSVWRTAYRLLSDRDDASDCYQETFLQALEYSRRKKIENWEAVLKRIATARALDRLRRRYRDRLEPMPDTLEAKSRQPPPDEAIQMREAIDRLRTALTKLPERQAEVFWLCEIEQLGHEQIAQQLVANPKQVAVWLHRAKRKLRTLLADSRIETSL